MIHLGEQKLTITNIAEVVYYNKAITLSANCEKLMEKSQHSVQRIITEGKPVYGINTGFGKFSEMKIADTTQLQDLQKHLVRSHACGVGEALPQEVVRAMMLMKAHALAKGYSGVRPEVVHLLLALLRKEITPIVPRIGSLGASGDLAPLAHVALVLIGEGEAIAQGKKMPGKAALESAGLSPLILEPKEGLALCNGTELMSAWSALHLHRIQQIIDSAHLVGAASVVASGSSTYPFMENVQKMKPHAGQLLSSQILRSYLHSYEGENLRVQEPYSFRCIPQVYGAAIDSIQHAVSIVEIEANSISDNPVFIDGKPVSGGNFHGEHMALAIDVVHLALNQFASLSERRIDHLLRESFSGAQSFLSAQPGLQSGLMIAHYTAAALVSEIKTLCSPVSFHSISVSDNQEDHVSLAPTALAKTGKILDDLCRVLAIELFCARELALRRKKGFPPAIAQRLQMIPFVPYTQDRSLSAEIETAAKLLDLQTHPDNRV